MNNELPLAGKTALVTGASRGLGEQIAKRLWSMGASLIITARQHHGADLLWDLVTILPSAVDSNQHIYSFYADLSQASGLHKVIDVMLVKGVDILVNNAAIQGPVGPLLGNTEMEWLDTMRVNLLSPVELCKVAAAFMATNGWGKIINISGGGAANPRPEYSAYATSKAGLVRFSECLAEELKSSHVDVNCVAPGLMPTRMSDWHGEEPTIQKAVDLVAYLSVHGSDGITGRFISAVYDPWRYDTFKARMEEDWDLYTLRRKAL